MSHDGPDPATPIRIEVLGPLRLLVDGAPVEVTGPKRRAILALLAKAEGRAVAVEHLIDALWPSDPPAAARAALHTHVSRLRRCLGSAATRLETTGGGYRLVIDDGALDVARVRALRHRARGLAADDPHLACTLLRQAQGSWHGDVLADLIDVPPLGAWAVALTELRREVGHLLVRCALDAGLVDEAVEVAGCSAATDPLSEAAALLHMRALAEQGRAAEALRVGYDFRRRLGEEAGLDPSEELAVLERDIAMSSSRERSGSTSVAAGSVVGPRLIGRRSEVAALRRLLDGERVISIVGPAGVGKTSVALEVASGFDPMTRLPLAAVSEPAGIVPALADALDLRVPRGDVLSACAALLGAGPRLLLLDNCEHLLDAAREVVMALVNACPQLTVLATSREPLRIPFERQCRLDPLPVPDPNRALEDASQVPAVQLFVDRARLVRPSFDLDRGALALIGEIVTRLDGLPLAIELAAGRMSAFGLTDLHHRLDRALDLLGDASASDPRHHTLRATIAWSDELLGDEERRLLRNLAVFPDGFDLATAERLAAELGLREDPGGVLAHLVDASMVIAELGDRPRYRMLETIRAFAVDRLRAGGEDVEASEQLLRWAVDLAARIATEASTLREPDADRLLRRELANLRAAWQLARRLGRIDAAIEIVTSLADPSAWRDLSEIWGWAQELADDADLSAHPKAAVALGAAAQTAWLQGDADRSARLAAAGSRGAAHDADRWRCSAALSVLALFRGDHDEAIDHALHARACAPVLTESDGVAALAAAYGGDLAQAKAHRDRLSGTAAYPSLQAFAAYVAGEIANVEGRTDEAESHYRLAIELGRSSGATFVQGIAAVGLLTVLARAGRVEDALRGYRELVDYWERTGSWIQQWTTLRNLAALLRDLDDPEPALFLETAAARAPDAPALDATSPQDGAPADSPVSSRVQVLQVARGAIDDHLQAVTRSVDGRR